MRTCQGYQTDWDDTDQIGTYMADYGTDEPIESFVCVGYCATTNNLHRWAVIDVDEDWEGPGVVCSRPTRTKAVEAAKAYLARKREQHCPGQE